MLDNFALQFIFISTNFGIFEQIQALVRFWLLTFKKSDLLVLIYPLLQILAKLVLFSDNSTRSKLKIYPKLTEYWRNIPQRLLIAAFVD